MARLQVPMVGLYHQRTYTQREPNPLETCQRPGRGSLVILGAGGQVVVFYIIYHAFDDAYIMHNFRGAHGFVHGQDMLSIYGVSFSSMHIGRTVCTMNILDHPHNHDHTAT